ncbi:TPA: DUF494 family protein [Candidatus Poribacteria bacterium]|nr:DUF494 family protein [Candidatus Poribacteria bacterium]HEX29347.1 DUF494 family protein [Candidatus Poribacteria bacterium]
MIMFQGRIKDILTYLVKRMLFQSDKTLTEEVIVEELLEKGFDMEEIEEALEMLSEIDTIEAHFSDLPASDSSIRVLSDYERHRLSLEAQGAIAMLAHFRVLSAQQVDELIDDVMSLPYPEISREDIIEKAVSMISKEEGVLPAIYLLKFLKGGD